MGEPTKTAPPPPETGSESERRRVGKVVHDDRGNALVEWEDAPADYQRVVLEVVNDGRSERVGGDDFNPYAQRVPRERCSTGNTGNTTRTDLRKLSEWIKKMRELEERKRTGDDGDDQDPD